jgi:hypothetical protein
VKRWARNKQIIDRVDLMLHQIGSEFTNTPGAGIGCAWFSQIRILLSNWQATSELPAN